MVQARVNGPSQECSSPVLGTPSPLSGVEVQRTWIVSAGNASSAVPAAPVDSCIPSEESLIREEWAWKRSIAHRLHHVRPNVAACATPHPRCSMPATGVQRGLEPSSSMIRCIVLEFAGTTQTTVQGLCVFTGWHP